MTRYVHEQQSIINQHICLNVKIVIAWPTVRGAENVFPQSVSHPQRRNPVSMNTQCSAKVKYDALYFCTSPNMHQYLNMMTDVRCLS